MFLGIPKCEPNTMYAYKKRDTLANISLLHVAVVSLMPNVISQSFLL